MKKKLLAFTMSFLLVLSVTACGAKTGSASSGQSAESTVTAVLKGLLQAPDKDLTASFQKGGTTLGLGVESSAQAASSGEDAVLQQKFGGYFTGDALKDFASTYLAPYQTSTQKNGATMKWKSSRVTKSGDRYDFSAVADYAGKSGSQEIKLSGRAQFSQDGKISFFRIDSDGGLSGLLRNG